MFHRLVTAIAAVALLSGPATAAPCGPEAGLDDTFGAAGRVAITPSTGDWAYADAIAVQADGLVVVGGQQHTSTTGDDAGATRVSQAFATVTRLHPDGHIDDTWGEGGLVGTPIRADADEVISALVALPGGGVLAAGSSHSDAGSVPFVIAYTSDGDLNGAFGAGGVALLAEPQQGTVTGLVQSASGGWFAVGGARVDTAWGVGAVRLNASGQPDPAFGVGGIAAFHQAAGCALIPARGAVAAADGGVFIGVTARCGDVFSVGVLRLTASGELATHYGVGGLARLNLGSARADARELVADLDGRPVLGGTVRVAGDRQMVVVRFSDSGGIDPGYGVHGGFTTLDAGDAWLRGMTLDASGRVVVAGHCQGVDDDDLCSARLDASGVPDPQWAAGGLGIHAAAASQRANAVVARPQGGVFIAGVGGGEPAPLLVAAVRPPCDAAPTETHCAPDAGCGDGVCGPFEAPCSCPADCGDDRDGDGLADMWEVAGIDADCDGVPELDLAALGANPDRYDVFLEIDYMVSDDHSHAPDEEALQLIVDAFAAAPVANPDGSTGITLHALVGEAIPHHDVILMGQSGEDAGTDDVIDFYAVKAEHFDAAFAPAFHYVVYAHDQQSLGYGSSGRAELRGNDVLVTFNPDLWRVTPMIEAGTLMHEVGHNLGLHHGGADGVNYKPNYQSVMNYRFQLRGMTASDLQTPAVVDFSREQLPTLDERDLDEHVGLSAVEGAFFTGYSCADGGHVPALTSGPVDWNCDGAINAGVVADINGEDDGDLLHGHDDWSALTFAFQCSGNFFDGVHAPDAFTVEPEITAFIAAQRALIAPTVAIGDTTRDVATSRTTQGGCSASDSAPAWPLAASFALLLLLAARRQRPKRR